MIVHDYECHLCEAITEKFVDSSNIPDAIKCPNCIGLATKIVSMRNTDTVDSSWIGSVVDVVQKNSNDPHCTEFIKHPTRHNYKKWMKGEGLRPLEDGEKQSYLTKPDRESKLKSLKHKMQIKNRERNSLTVET